MRKGEGSTLSPTVFYEGKYRFFFFSREEARMHVHVSCADGEAKFWLEPEISPAGSYSLTSRQMKKLQQLVKERQSEIKDYWKKHFRS